MSDRSVVPFSGGLPAARPAGDVGRWRPQAPPTHQARAMGLKGSDLRDDLWHRLGPGVRQRLQERAGRTLEWFVTEDASDPQRRPYAVVIGESALCVAEPRINAQHKPVYAMTAYELGAFRHKDIDHRPPPGFRAAPSAGPGSAARPSGPGSPPTAPGGPDLSASARGLLGNLPPEAQELLQAPFGGGRELTRCDWYYHGWEHHLEVFVIYLAGPGDVTFATGTKTIPAGHDDASAHWTLRCHRAPVVRRVGR
ncbi:hypothetical protein [Actinocorallia longicatena]|uniref:Uncharacterized protein n=1 Tax=Actinocorallia longicatena TaxID=111803 RepID=A0ABP6Q2R9_9ACTN